MNPSSNTHDSVRRPLRLLAFLTMLVGVAAFVMPLVLGPSDAAEAMGRSCTTVRNGPVSQCTAADVLWLFWVFGGVAVFTGLIASLALRGDRPARTIDLSFLRR